MNNVKESASIIGSTLISGVVNDSSVYYGWYGGKYELILNLGKMKKAIVIRKLLSEERYVISEGSFFPFSRDIYSSK